MELLIALGGAVVYGLLAYWKKRPKGEAFQPRKVVRTAIVAIALGLLAWWKGDVLTPENFEVYAAANAIVVGAVDQAFKWGYRIIANKFGWTDA